MSAVNYSIIEDCLGEKNKRYFSNGFKHIKYKYNNLLFNDKEAEGSVSISYNWEFKQQRHSHLGTIEYIAIALQVAEKILQMKISLTESEIARSWISNFQMKIRKCILLSERNLITFKCRFQKILNDKGQLINDFQLILCDNIIKFSIISDKYNKENHDVIPRKKSISLFQNGYKKRSHIIKNITLFNQLKSCNASFAIKRTNSRISGIGSFYDGILITDIIIISGQLIEVILKNQEKYGDKKHINLWLREFNMKTKFPEINKNDYISIFINNLNILEKKNELWKMFSFTSVMGNINSQIKAVSQLKN